MLASLDEPPVTQPGLFYEPKYVAIYSRNGNEKTKQFPEIAGVLADIAKKLEGPVLLDGEIVAIDRTGRPLGFQQIQGRIHLTGTGEIARAEQDAPTALIVFDLL